MNGTFNELINCGVSGISLLNNAIEFGTNVGHNRFVCVTTVSFLKDEKLLRSVRLANFDLLVWE